MMKMGFGYAFQAFVLVLSVAMAAEARSIVVGGSENWRPGFNYTDWALKNSPFYINDTLVFKYEAPHNVYLLPNLWSFIKCDFKDAKLIASAEDGGGDGIKVDLTATRLYYFASSDSDDCSAGMMKFFAVPLPRLQG
ncbi:uncharacterized protein LOC104447762 [Eucalyptus grandis]|uniref:uncharacterized protein LOC104447762 n=1 Tax=Eucalyptus grandis TaxID=71139 RepID=UPI00192E75D9|nr:uncharacterized protein LOC104447762 [Eucalyptus grandis]